MPTGSLYLAIYVGGFTFLFLYNVTTGIFSAMGDSKTPLYFLIGSSVGNIVLDYIFVRYFSWGVAGVAWATFIAQGVACVLALITLQFRIGRIQVEGHADLFSRRMLMQIARVAIPSILQQSFISVGNIFIQWLVNGFGSSVIAGYSAAVKLNTFGLTCFTTLGKRRFQLYGAESGCRKRGPRAQRSAHGLGHGHDRLCAVRGVLYRVRRCVRRHFHGERLKRRRLADGC